LVSGLAEGLVRLARSAELRQRLGEVGRRRIETHFDWDRKVDTMLQLYRLVVADARAAPGRVH
jgi:glycosyltransferase involved in cell wall biosynthesis